MNYSDQIKSPKWQKKRLEILELRGFKCEICSDEENQLHVHHRFYIKGRKAWEYDNDVFQVLCHKCHEKEHSKVTKNEFSEYENELIIALRKAKVFDSEVNWLTLLLENYDRYGNGLFNNIHSLISGENDSLMETMQEYFRNYWENIGYVMEINELKNELKEIKNYTNPIKKHENGFLPGTITINKSSSKIRKDDKINSGLCYNADKTPF